MTDTDDTTLGACPFCWREPCACEHPQMTATLANLPPTLRWAEPGEIIEED